jgi:uncharacterized membrane protein YhaH (DUF805 family)
VAVTIFHTLFGAVRGGTIHRIHFFWYIAGLWTVGAAVLMTLSLSIGMQQPMEGLTTEQAQQAARDTLGSLGQVVVIVLGLLFLFAQVNLIAKRIRDTGLPGWLDWAGRRGHREYGVLDHPAVHAAGYLRTTGSEAGLKRPVFHVKQRPGRMGTMSLKPRAAHQIRSAEFEYATCG